MRRWPLVSVVLLIGCSSEPSLEVTRAGLGEPNGDYPSYDERVCVYATNRARTEPLAFRASGQTWSGYSAQPPLQWSYELNQASRAHSTDMAATPCFAHDNCDGSQTWDQRILSYYKASWSGIGENIAGGTSIDGQVAVYNWINEIGAAPGTTGHRDNIFSADFNLLGCGYATGGTLGKYWTQDFIRTSSVTRPTIADGIHFPQKASTGGSLTFGTTYYASSVPSRVVVVVDGVCRALARAYGTDSQGAFQTSLALSDGCHPYHFLATTNGVDTTYPTTGSLQAGWGNSGSACALYLSTRQSADCQGGGSGGASGSGGATGSGGASGSGGSGSGGSGSGGATGSGGSGSGGSGSGGATGSGGSGSGGSGSGGSGSGGSGSGGSGSGGVIAGSGGSVAGSGGSVAGSGGSVAGSGGVIAGSGGIVTGSGGIVTGSGGSVTGSGGSVAGSGGIVAGSGGIGGAGGIPGSGGTGAGGAGSTVVGSGCCSVASGGAADPISVLAGIAVFLVARRRRR